MNHRIRRTLPALVLSAATLAGAVTISATPALAAQNRPCGPTTSADAAVAAQLRPAITTGNLANSMSAYNVSCARAIVNTVRGMGLPDRAAVAAVTTAIVESALENNPNVIDATSVGLFQQQTWWGTTEQRLDPAWATTAFINEMLRKYPDNSWQSQPIGEVCQRVQVSAYPERYAAEVPNGQKVVDALGTAAPGSGPLPVSSLVSGKVASVYNPDTKTAEAFAVDAKGQMRHSYSTGGAAWSDWSLLVADSTELAGSPAVVYNPVNKVTEVFAKRASDGAMLHSYLFNGATWKGWESLGDGWGFGGSPTAVYNAATNAIELFAIGTDGVLNHDYNLDAGAWHGWESLDRNKKFTIGTPAAVYNPDTRTAEVFATDDNNVVAHNYSTGGGSYEGWSPVAGGFKSTFNPAVVYNPVNKVTEVFATGTNKAVSHAYLFNGATWQGWESLGDGWQATSSPAAVYNATTNAIELFAIGTDGAMNHDYNLSAGAWHGWESLNTKWAFTGTPSAVYESDNRAAEVFGIGSVDGKISKAYTADGQSITPWYTLGDTQFKTR